MYLVHTACLFEKAKKKYHHRLRKRNIWLEAMTLIKDVTWKNSFQSWFFFLCRQYIFCKLSILMIWVSSGECFLMNITKQLRRAFLDSNPTEIIIQQIPGNKSIRINAFPFLDKLITMNFAKVHFVFTVETEISKSFRIVLLAFN